MYKKIDYLKFLPKIIFFIVVVKPLVNVFLGLNIRNKHLLPNKGPAIIVANHNSHLDVLVLMALFPIKSLLLLQPVGAEDYFFKNKFRKWFTTKIMDAIPISRKGELPKEHILKPCELALANEKIIILFPEGTRGEPEHLGQLHKGVWHLSKKMKDVPIIPIFLYGLGKSLPKGEGLFVPFFVDVFINSAIYYEQSSEVLLNNIKNCFAGDLSKY
jgi:1-acyl-sn-glycerol-3-phosphate acyltransferase